ncbi:ribulose-phosphate 3-epimerase [Candidatus Azobacteroides pseudotrichonymphae]|uniref:Ribulose-phosphate 3-epimerase n=1 Tax=Azobacteroides pseudotrichonymphae genomovar. CFP2 TaxID=511995 RepID=B6YQI5_AZOPC|nr:ribulose-phosphate 3-epimerase [Candidatus Azobacteroides pseudotrichonymphae]BAG83457.1 ribulose-phosphate 3-epimerase [Candidatus Azobacteroides pseudotrichonymphae genomovar. CFP2]
MSFILAPSLLSANFLHLEEEIEILNGSMADRLHLDIMDGVFVPNISIGLQQVKHLSRISFKPLDAHLMIVEPQKFIGLFRDFGIQTLTIHYETCTHLHKIIMQIKENGMKVGVALNPHTPIEVLTDVLEELDRVLILSVNPGFGGQKFIPNSYSKVSRLKNLINKKELNTSIEVDGGIDIKTGKMMLEAGANILVVGSFIFEAKNPIEMIKQMKGL